MYCGLHPHLFQDAFDLELQSNDVLDSLSKPIFWMLRFVGLVLNAHHTLMRGRYGEEDVEMPYQLLSMVKFYDDEILRIRRQAQAYLGKGLPPRSGPPFPNFENLIINSWDLFQLC